MLRVEDLPRQAAFWSAALDAEPVHPPEEHWVLLAGRSGRGPRLGLDARPSRRERPPRLHLGLYTHDQEGEVRRLLTLGATRINWDRPADADFVTLADPEGYAFDVVQLPDPA